MVFLDRGFDAGSWNAFIASIMSRLPSPMKVSENFGTGRSR